MVPFYCVSVQARWGKGAFSKPVSKAIHPIHEDAALMTYYPHPQNPTS
jgi:hypothetical protein